MLKRFINTATCIAIAILLLLNGTSHDFIHLFAGHSDTVDCNHNNHADHSASFEQQHHHCDFLDLQTPVFLHPSANFYLFNSLQHNTYFVLAVLPSISREIGHTSLRGPPIPS